MSEAEKNAERDVYRSLFALERAAEGQSEAIRQLHEALNAARRALNRELPPLKKRKEWGQTDTSILSGGGKGGPTEGTP